MPENPQWPGYARCRLCHHLKTSSMHSLGLESHELVHAFILAAPGEIPDGWKDPKEIERDIKAHRQPA